MPGSTRTSAVGAAALLLAVLAGAPSSAGAVPQPGLPGSYLVSRAPGVLPEGIAVHPDGRMYVTSDATGALYAGDVRHSRLHPFPAEGAEERGNARGVHTDRRGRVFSVGADTLTVHDTRGRLLAERTADDGPLGGADLNDLVVTDEFVYVTDWANPVVHRARIRHGVVGPLEPWLDIRSAFPEFPAQYWLLNGIVADGTGETLLVASNGTEAVWRVDVATREVAQLDLGGQSFGADGMALHGRTLYAVLNYGAPHGVYVAELDDGLRAGTVTHRITGEGFDLPTTLARYGCRLYVVNSQLDDPPGEPPYTVSAIDDPACERS